jgi:hypothetical protein
LLIDEMRVMRVTGNEYCDEISLFHFFPVARPTIVMARWIGSTRISHKNPHLFMLICVNISRKTWRCTTMPDFDGTGPLKQGRRTGGGLGPGNKQRDVCSSKNDMTNSSMDTDNDPA